MEKKYVLTESMKEFVLGHYSQYDERFSSGEEEKTELLQELEDDFDEAFYTLTQDGYFTADELPDAITEYAYSLLECARTIKKYGGADILKRIYDHADESLNMAEGTDEETMKLAKSILDYVKESIQYYAKMDLAFSDCDDEKRKAVTCAILGHSKIVTTFFGYVNCARCGAQIGDALGGLFDGSNVVIVGHNCDVCRANYKKLSWKDKVLAPNPFMREEDER